MLDIRSNARLPRWFCSASEQTAAPKAPPVDFITPPPPALTAGGENHGFARKVALLSAVVASLALCPRFGEPRAPFKRRQPPFSASRKPEGLHRGAHLHERACLQLARESARLPSG